MQRLLVLTGFIIVGLFGLSELPNKPDPILVSMPEGDASFDSPVTSAVLYSDDKPSGLWTSGNMVNVVARRTRHRRRVVVRRRKFSHSAAIVGGSAGRKGAAIGALAGGGAGYIYDRKTHKKRVVVRE